MCGNKLILGKGLLGNTLKIKTGWDCLYRGETHFDFSNILTYKHLLEEYQEIINCIAYTRTYEDNKKEHWGVNYKGVADLCDFCNESGKKLIHISTSYVYSFSDHPSSEDTVPVHCKSWYGYTKLLADGYLELRSKDYLIIRAMFKKRPFPYNVAYTNQVGNFDYVDIIADHIIDLINKNASGIINVGTQLKSMYDLAKESNPEIASAISPVTDMPLNTSMEMSRMRSFL